MTLYIPSDEESIEGIGAWDTSRENGPTPHLDDPNVPALAAFELDREARANAHYLNLLLAHRDCGASRVNGSIGGTKILDNAPIVEAPIHVVVNSVSRGAW